MTNNLGIHTIQLIEKSPELLSEGFFLYISGIVKLRKKFFTYPNKCPFIPLKSFCKSRDTSKFDYP